MGRPDFSSCWRLLLLLGLCLCVSAEPQFLVVLPAVVESGTTVRFCFSLLHVSEDLSLSASLESRGEKTNVFTETYDDDKHSCGTFQAPVVSNPEIWNFEVELQGKKFHRKETHKIQIRNYGHQTFIQTDKPLYLPGQTVRFRVVTVDSGLRPAQGLFDLIEIKDPVQNRVAQWLDVAPDLRILQLSYDLDPQVRQGIYTVSVKVKGQTSTVTKNFEVKKYVLPKFSVEVEAPAEVSIAAEDLNFKVCAKYTFGQPVPGRLQVDLCRYVAPKMHRYGGWSLDDSPPLCLKQLQQQVSDDGCVSYSLQPAPLKNYTHLDSQYVIQAVMTEEGTELELSGRQHVIISYVIGKVEFVDPPKRYERGDVLEFKVRAVHYNDTPMAHTDVHLLRDYDLLHTQTTDHSGLASFSLNTTDYAGILDLRVSVYQNYQETHKTPHVSSASVRLKEVVPLSLHTRSTSSLEVLGGDRTLQCGASETLSMGYTIVGDTQGTLTIIYLILSRGFIMKYGNYSTYMDTVAEGKLSFELDVSPDLAPVVTLVSYAVLPSDTIIATSQEFTTDNCFNNKVEVHFSSPVSVPGEDLSLQVSASPQSLCGLSAVDKSVLLMAPGKNLKPDEILKLLPVTKTQPFPDQIEDSLGCFKVRSKKSLYPVYPVPNSGDDVYKLLKNRGLKMATNLFIRTPSCVNFRGTEYHQIRAYYDYGVGARLGGSWVPQMSTASSAPAFPPSLPPIETVRSFFPETWIWDLVEVGSSGAASLSISVPDTLTSWETDVFCLSPETGIGLATPQNLTVFQPFFLELSLPYSIIRGESFELKATVFNYLSSCIMMDVQAAPSADYTLTPLSSDQYKSCLCGNERRTVSWTLLASALGEVNVTVSAEAVPSDVRCNNEVLSVPERGRKDVVTRSLRVQAEGTEVSKAYNWLMCPKGESLKKELDLTLPENVIPGSARVSISVLGDILGRAMKNLDGLLKMPFGCGEQNMALLAPNIYVLQYLTHTHQLSPEVQERALKFLQSGYQRQLNYEHSDGGYSAFGRGEANTWLTAFVVRSFSKAQSFIYMDPTKLLKSRVWLEKRQRTDGCFQPSGSLFNNRMKGGVSDDVTLSAYITAALLESNMTTSDPVVSRGLACLHNHSHTQNTYTLALMSYVFSLAGDTETRAQLLSRLRDAATERDGEVLWSSSSSLSVEISSYVLLSSLTQASVSVEDLGYVTKIVRWLTSQQNPYGGFKSTQDTVVALQALSLYSALTYSPEGSSSVVVQDLSRSPEGTLSFSVEPSNKLLYQERGLGGAAGKYSVEVTGNACASVQMTVHYNIPPPSEVHTLGVKVEPQMDCGRTALELHLQAQYLGDLNSTNMVIVDIKRLSGFVSDEKSLKNLEFKAGVDRVEQSGDHVLIYITQLSKDQTLSLSLRLVQETVVENLKPALVKIYDYYQPSDEAETEYTSPCAAANEEQNIL